MSSKNNSDVSKLLQSIEKLGAIGAVITFVVLGGLYIWIASIPKPPLATTDVIWILHDLALSLLSGMIPVFILFVISYALFKEIDRFKEKEKTTKFAEEVSKRVSESFGKPVADVFFSSKKSEESIISSSHEELCLVQETGSLISETYRSEIIQFIQREGKLKIIIVNPIPPVSDLMTMRNATLSSSRSFSARTEKFIDHISEISKSSKANFEQIQIRSISYPICSTFVIADRNSSLEEQKIAIIRLAGFKVPYEKKLDFEVCRANSKRVFDNYCGQFDSMWALSTKLIVITGKPRAGKSTLLGNLRKKSGNLNTYFAISKELLDDSKNRYGFEVITSKSSKPIEFANKGDSETYSVNIQIWDDISEEITEAVRDGVKVFFIDEVGPLQLKSTKFHNVIEELINLTGLCIYITAADDSLVDESSLVAKLKKNNRASVVILDAQNRDKIENNLTLELEQYLEGAIHV